MKEFCFVASETSGGLFVKFLAATLRQCLEIEGRKSANIFGFFATFCAHVGEKFRLNSALITLARNNEGKNAQEGRKIARKQEIEKARKSGGQGKENLTLKTLTSLSKDSRSLALLSKAMIALIILEYSLCFFP